MSKTSVSLLHPPPRTPSVSGRINRPDRSEGEREQERKHKYIHLFIKNTNKSDGGDESVSDVCIYQSETCETAATEAGNNHISFTHSRLQMWRSVAHTFSTLASMEFDSSCMTMCPWAGEKPNLTV